MLYYRNNGSKFIMAEKERKIEDIFEELDAIVSEVENDVMPLEKMVDRITHASKLIQQCRKKLNAMNAKVELMFKDDGGQGEFTDFDPASDRSQAAGAVEKNPRKKNPAATDDDRQDVLPF